jgi:hypothetical protein
MDYNFSIISGLKNNSRRVLSNTKKHNFHNLVRSLSPSAYDVGGYETDTEEAYAADAVIEYDPSDYDTLSDIM